MTDPSDAESTVQSLSEKLSNFADQSADQNKKNSDNLELIMAQLSSLVTVNKQLTTRLDELESNPSTPPGAPVKQKKISKKNLKNLSVKIESNDPFSVSDTQGYDSDESQQSGISCISNKDDLQFITSISKPGFQNTEQSKKDQRMQLLKIQERYRNTIPKLAFDASVAGLPPTHNYGVWIKKLLMYYTVLSPQLAKSVKLFLSSIDIDEILKDGASSAKAPELSEEIYPLIMRLSAMSSLVDSLDGDFVHLAEESMTDIFPTLVNILAICAPNSQEDRTENLADFFSLRHEDSEALFKFSARLENYAEKVNGQYDTEQSQKNKFILRSYLV